MKEAKRLRAEGGTDRYLTHSEDLKSASIFHTRLLRRLTYEFAEYRAPLRDPHLRRLIQDYPVKLEEMKRLKDNGVSGDDILRWQLLNFADMRLADVWRNPRFQKDRLETRALNAWLRVMDDVEHFCRSKSFALGDHSDIVHCPETGMHLAASGVDLVLRKLEYLQSAIGTERDSCTSIRFNVALMHVILRYEALASAVAWKHSRFDAWSQGEDAKSFLKMQEKARFLLELLGKSGAETTPIDRSRLEPLADALKITLDGSQQTEPFSGCGLTALAVFVRLMAGDDEKAINAEQLLRRLAAWEKRVDDCLGNRTRLTMAVYRDLGEEQKRLWDILQGFALGRSRFYGVMKDDMGAMTTRSVSVEVEGETLAVAPTMVLALTSNPLEKNLAKGDLVSVDVMDGQVVALSNLSKTLVSLFPEPEIDEGTMKMGFKENIEKAIFSAILLRDLAQINDHFPNAMSSSEYDIVFERTLDILNETLRTSVSLSVGRNLSELKIPNMKSYPEAVGFLTLLLMNHPDADRSSSNNLDVSIFGSILQLAQEKADSESTELLRMLQSIMIEKCWAPEDFKQDTGRSFYLFLEYWYRLRAVVLLQMSSYAFFFPHPMQRLLYNLRERLQHCLNHLQLEETEEIRKITSGIIELLLDPDQDVFQIIEDEIKSQIAEVERFIEESRYKVSVHEVILEPERLFLSLFDQSLDETGKSTTKAWKGILRKTDAQQQDLHAHQQTDQKQPQETEEPFQFYQDGDFWVIRYEGRTIPPIKKIDGLFYLSVLLARQSHGEISPLELQSLLHPPSTKMDEKQLQKLSDEDLAAMSVHVESGEPQLAPEQLREIRARRQGYQEEIEEWEAQGNEKMAAEVREKADQLDSYLKSAVGLKGRVRKTSKLLENSRTTVKNSVKRALEKIKHHDMPLYLHLLNHVKTGHGCSYHPDRPIPWKTEKTS